MPRPILVSCLWGLLAVAGPGQAETLRLDGYDYALDSTVSIVFAYERALLQLGQSSLSGCARANGGAQNVGSLQIEFAGNGPTLFSNADVTISTEVPQIWITSVDGDYRCAGGAVSGMLTDSFE